MNAQNELKQVVSDSVQIIDFIHKDGHLEIKERSAFDVTMLDAIEYQSLAVIRSGGPSVLSTMLHRGMASRHIGILWAGFNIQSVVNGTFDVGLIRNIFDEPKFYQNGTSSIIGNASMAGALSLENQIITTNSTKFNLSTSSTKNFNFSFRNRFKYKKYTHNLTINQTTDKNEYSYYNGRQKQTQNLAKFSMQALNYEGHFIVSDKFAFAGGLWLQNADRNIPPTKTSASILQKQKDVNNRGFIRGTYYPTERTKLIFRTAYFDELLDYESPGIKSVAESKIFNGAVDFIHNAGLSLSTQFRKDRVDASFFNPIQERNTFAVLADYSSTFIANTEFGISVRTEWVDSDFQPLVLGVRLENNLHNNLTATFKYNKGYTLPSFNDLYWPTGGNPDLKTERSHDFDIGFKFQNSLQKNRNLQLNIFYNLIDDWIQWTPIQGFFQPVNQRKVRNIGFELKAGESIQINERNLLKLNLLYGFTDSRLMKHYLNPENEGKNTIFVPRHKLTGQISWIHQSWQLHLRPLYYSKRFNTVDNSSHTPGYFIMDFEVIKSFMIKKSKLSIALSIENSFDNDYENIRFYPMPLRVFRLGVNIEL